MIGVRSFLVARRAGSSACVLALATGAVALVTACGGAAPAPTAPAAKGPESAGGAGAEPASIEEAQAEIATARAQLGGGDTGSSRFAPAPSPPPPSASPAAPPSADTSAPGPQDRCGSPCRALASMRRAVTALCRMTGNDDARCTDAKRTLSDSEGRVAPCSC